MFIEGRFFIFGPFVLIPEQQMLLRGEVPVRLGSRALDILAVLVQRPGKLVSKEELISQVWPDTFVGESNLKVNVVGRGYRFVAPVQTCGMNAWVRRAEHFFNLPRPPKGLARRDIKNSALAERGF